MAPHPALRSLLDVPAGPMRPGSAPDPRTEPLLRSLLVADTGLADTGLADTGLADTAPAPLTVVLTGGAAQVGGPAAYCVRRGWQLLAVRTVLRDLDDLAGNARRVIAAVDAARADGTLAEETAVHVGLPAGEATYSWLSAADELAAAELALALPVADAPAEVLAGWLAAALDRELPFTCTGADGRAHGSPAGPGLLDLLGATVRCFDGGSASEVAAVLTGADAAPPDLDELARVRRWLVGVDAADPGATRADLEALGLLRPAG